MIFSAKKTYFTCERQIFGDISRQSSRCHATRIQHQYANLSLNRIVPQVLLHKLIEYFFIFNQNML